MSPLRVKLPDGSDLELADGATGADAAAAIGPGLAKAALAVKLDGELRDLAAPLADGSAIEIVTDRSPEALELVRHDAAHVLAEAVESVSLYRNGPFTDLCRGPHGPSTGRIGALKLTSLAGAYWRGDESRPMLTRIYGTAFFSKRDLEEHLRRREEAKARDHRRLGPELGIFTLRPEAPGMPFWLPQGTILLGLIEAEVREQLRRGGYVEIKTPLVMDEELWRRSGHWENYRDDMFFIESGERRFALKPMNCPGACLVFGSERRSYRDLPLRLAEFGQVSRDEREGVLHGLLRVRAFTQDDAHVYCTLDQIGDEVDAICSAIDQLYARFG